MLKKMFCHNCNREVEIDTFEEKRKYTVKECEYEILDTITVCKNCKEEIFNKDKDSKILKEINNMYRKDHNLLLPEEIKRIRETYGLTQREFSKLLGFGDVTISRYENGAIQDKANNNLIVLCEKPGNVLQLTLDADKRLSNDIKQRIVRFIDSIPDIFDIADLFISRLIEKHISLTNMKLQKLCYFFWAKAILKNSKFLDIRFEAWQHGPVNRDLYNKYKHLGSNNIDFKNKQEENEENDIHKFDKIDLEIFEDVLNKYGKCDANYLREESHKEPAWKEANPHGRHSTNVMDYKIVRESRLKQLNF